MKLSKLRELSEDYIADIRVKLGLSSCICAVKYAEFFLEQRWSKYNGPFLLPIMAVKFLYERYKNRSNFCELWNVKRK